ncbi:MAG: lipoyl(octanoyl) transferase LipB [Tannerella sp.]|jgi:lipoyl(octanoyl) transferase|nr:lipoyl(octanoyl) transferase LipB [Tannerella sp.]
MEPFVFQDLGRIEYTKALTIQTTAFEAILAAKARGEKCENKLFFCEHEPVITLGKNGLPSNLLISEKHLKDKGISFYPTNRGGDITYHGPGQITGYPVFDLETFGMGLRQYIETLEEIIIRLLDMYGIHGERLAGATGVWLDTQTARARKICAIGVRSSRFVTMHGFALNVSTDLRAFSLIHPCGFTDKGVTSLAMELNRAIDIEDVKIRLRKIFNEIFFRFFFKR